MAKKITKREIVAEATNRINEAVKSCRLEDVQLDDLLLLMPGGKAREAIFVGVRSLLATPGMRMDKLLDTCCTESTLHMSTGGWVVGREWGNFKGFGPLGLFFERRKERHADDKRTVWHYYLLPPGKMLAECPIDARQQVIDANMNVLKNLPKPGSLLMKQLMVRAVIEDSHYHHTWLVTSDSPAVTIEDEMTTACIITGYAGEVYRMKKVSWATTLVLWKTLIVASGPDDPNWKEVVRSRKMYITAIGGVPGDQNLAIGIYDAAGIKAETEAEE